MSRVIDRERWYERSRGVLETGTNSCLAFGSAATQCDFNSAALRACSSARALAGSSMIRALPTTIASLETTKGWLKRNDVRGGTACAAPGGRYLNRGSTPPPPDLCWLLHNTALHTAATAAGSGRHVEEQANGRVRARDVSGRLAAGLPPLLGRAARAGGAPAHRALQELGPLALLVERLRLSQPFAERQRLAQPCPQLAAW
eukprot:scaffold133110_cov63-Phaeocystis_antarctica.AAC.7